jgi:hypothetical protein
VQAIRSSARSLSLSSITPSEWFTAIEAFHIRTLSFTLSWYFLVVLYMLSPPTIQ